MLSALLISRVGNLRLLANVTGVFPKGLFIDNIIEAMSEELKEECDYELEAKNQVSLRAYNKS